MSTPQTDRYEKAHADNVGLDMIGRLNATTRQGLADDITLLSLYNLYEELGITDKLLDIDSDITITTGFDKGTIAQTAGTIGLVLNNTQDEPINLASVMPNSNQKPLIIDRMQPSALIIGVLENAHELIAVDNLNDAVKLAYGFMTDNVTLLVSLDKLLFNSMVSHFAEAYPVTIFTTLDKKDTACKPLAGANVKAVITSDRNVLEHLEYGNLSYSEILALDDTAIINLQNEIWAEPEPLSNDPSKPIPYPIEAFTGLLKKVVEAIAYYSQVPTAMAGQSVLGALAHMGQRFIDAPMGHSHQPASLMIIIEGESGSGKSKCMGLTHFKIREYERQQYEAYTKDLDKWNKEKIATPFKQMQAFLEKNPKPQNPVTVFKDATIEPILDKFVGGDMHNASWTTDEAGQFFSGHTMKGDTAGSALSALTTIHSDGEIARLRSQKNAYAMAKTNAYSVRLTLVLMGQRVVLEEALSDPLMNEQGFLARALIACPEDLRGKRTLDDMQRIKDKPHDNPDLIEYWARCQNLLIPFLGNIPRALDGKESPRIKIQWADQQAEQIFYQHMQAIENRQAKGKEFEYLKGYASRMAENASRIASLMTYFEGRNTITTDDITRAFMLVEYSTAERLRYVDATPQGAQNNSEKLSSWLVDKARSKTPHKLNRTYISNNAPSPMRSNTKILQAELYKLESAGHIKQEMEGSKNVVYINPKLYG